MYIIVIMCRMLQFCYMLMMMMFFFAFRSDFVYDLFEHMSVSDQGGGGKRPTMMGKRGGKPSRKKTTVSSQFKVSPLMNHAIAGFYFGWIQGGGI